MIPRIRFEPLAVAVPRLRVPAIDLAIPDIDFPGYAWDRDLGRARRRDLRHLLREMRHFGRDMRRWGRDWRDGEPRVRSRTSRYQPT